MLNVGDKVKIISLDGNVNNIFFERVGIIDKIKENEHYCYHLCFINADLNHEGEYFWWSAENLVLTDEFEDNSKIIDLYKTNERTLDINKPFPNILQSILLLFGLFVIQVFVVILFSLIAMPFGVKYGSNSVLLTSAICAGNVLIILIGRRSSGNSVRQMFKNPPFDGKLILYSIILLIGWWCIILPFLDLVMHTSITLNNSGKELNKVFSRVFTGIFGLFYVSILGPLLEEIIFRGIILRGLLKNYKPAVAIIVSALLFGIFHFNLAQSCTAFGLGIILALIYVKTGSLKMCFLIHALNNSFVSLAFYPINKNLTLSAIIGSIIIIFTAIKIYKSPNKFEGITTQESPQAAEL